MAGAMSKLASLKKAGTVVEKAKPKAIFGLGAVPLNWVLGLGGTANRESATHTISEWRGRRVPILVGSHM